MCILSGMQGSNPTGARLATNWFSRVEEKRPGRALSHWSSVRSLMAVKSASSDLEALLAHPDATRICNSVELIVKGLYFEVYKTILTGTVQVVFEWPHGNVVHNPSLDNRFVEKVTNALNKGKSVFRGPNPKVFRFRTHRHYFAGQEWGTFELVFYGHHRAVAITCSDTDAIANPG